MRRWDFEDLTLAAFYFHPDLEVARAQWAVARASEITAGERPNPTVGISPAYNSTTAIPSPWIVTVTGELPLETAGKRGYRVAEATKLAEAARLNIASVAWQVRSRVRNRMWDLQSAEELQSLLEQQQAIHAENVRLLQLQHDAGAISAFELTQAKLAADESRLALRDAGQQTAEARVQLADAIGVPVTALKGVKISQEDQAQLAHQILTADARHQALMNRADLLASLAEYAASEAALQLEIAKQYPDVHLGPGYEFDQGDNKWSLGLSVTLPVFNRNQGAIAEAEARRAESAARFNALQARVLSEIDLATAAYQASRSKLSDAEKILGDVGKQEKAADALLAAGEISKGDVAALQLQLGTSKLVRHEAFVKVRQAAGQLEDAVQRPLDLPAAAWQDAPRVTESSSPTVR